MGVPELLIIFAIVVVLFGASQLPKLARSLGKAKSDFEQAARDRDRRADDE